MYIVSCCLLGVNCKYSGGNNGNEKVIQFLSDKEYVAVCPEVRGGLPIPRTPAERVGDKVLTKDGRDVTSEYTDGAELCLQYVKAYAEELGEEIEGAILKNNSPSCGFRSIYDGTFSGKTIEGNGVFAEKLLAEGINIKTEKEI